MSASSHPLQRKAPGPAASEEFFLSHGPGQVIALGFVAAKGPQHLQAFETLDALGHGAIAQLPGQGDDRAGDLLVLGAALEVGDHGFVELHHIGWNLVQVGEVAVAGAEIIDGHVHAQRPDLAQLIQHPGVGAQPGAFGDFHLEALGAMP